MEHAPRLPSSLDPLIAEAKRRARMRRFLLVGVGVAAAGVLIGTVVLRASERPRPAVVANVPACRSDQLRLGWGPAGVAAGTVGEAFTFTNISQSACALHGWPSLRFVLHDGRQVDPRAHYVPALAYSASHPPRLRRIVVQPSATAPWSVMASDFAARGGCRMTRLALVIPPGGHSVLSVAASVPYCGPHRMWVLPVGPGPLAAHWFGG